MLAFPGTAKRHRSPVGRPVGTALLASSIGSRRDASHHRDASPDIRVSVSVHSRQARHRRPTGRGTWTLAGTRRGHIGNPHRQGWSGPGTCPVRGRDRSTTRLDDTSCVDTSTLRTDTQRPLAQAKEASVGSGGEARRVFQAQGPPADRPQVVLVGKGTPAQRHPWWVGPPAGLLNRGRPRAGGRARLAALPNAPRQPDRTSGWRRCPAWHSPAVGGWQVWSLLPVSAASQPHTGVGHPTRDDRRVRREAAGVERDDGWGASQGSAWQPPCPRPLRGARNGNRKATVRPEGCDSARGGCAVPRPLRDATPREWRAPRNQGDPQAHPSTGAGQRPSLLPSAPAPTPASLPGRASPARGVRASTTLPRGTPGSRGVVVAHSIRLSGRGVARGLRLEPLAGGSSTRPHTALATAGSHGSSRAACAPTRR